MKLFGFISIFLLCCSGCNRLPYCKGFVFENNTSQTIFVTSASSSMQKIRIEPNHIGEIDHFKGRLVITNDKGYFWDIENLYFFSGSFLSDREKNFPCYIKNKRNYFFERYNQSIQMRIEDDKLYVMPADEPMQGLYKRLQPDGFPIIGVHTNIAPKVSIPAQ